MSIWKKNKKSAKIWKKVYRTTFWAIGGHVKKWGGWSEWVWICPLSHSRHAKPEESPVGHFLDTFEVASSCLHTTAASYGKSLWEVSEVSGSKRRSKMDVRSQNRSKALIWTPLRRNKWYVAEKSAKKVCKKRWWKVKNRLFFDHSFPQVHFWSSPKSVFFILKSQNEPLSNYGKQK